MSLPCQVKILRVLQEKKVVPVGSEKEIESNARIIAATNRHLDQLVTKGKFRKDLYYRLCGLEIHIPRLCERRSDIPLLIDYFINKTFNNKNINPEKKAVSRVSHEVLDILMLHSWPGNVRQLEQAIMAAMAVCDNEIITVSDLPAWLKRPLKTQEKHKQEISIKTANTQVDFENAKYIDALNDTCYPGTGRWNVAAAARLLKIPRKTLVYRIKKMNIMEE